MDQAATPLPFYCRAYRRLEAQAANGHGFTVDELESAIEADEPTRKVFAELAADIRAGRDVTVAELAAKARMPEGFVVFLVEALVGQLLMAAKTETIN